jgi:hypothetical protein
LSLQNPYPCAPRPLIRHDAPKRTTPIKFGNRLLGAFDEQGNSKNSDVSRKIFASPTNALAPDTLPEEIMRDLLNKN